MAHLPSSMRTRSVGDELIGSEASGRLHTLIRYETSGPILTVSPEAWRAFLVSP